MRYQYKVVPAPTKGTKAKGLKTPEGRFANSVEAVLNTLAADGWDYLRAELLPSEERTGLTGSATNWRNVLVFRKAITAAAQAETVQPVETVQPDTAEALNGPEPLAASGAERMLKDNGVEELSPVSGMTTALKSRARQQAESDTQAKGADIGKD